jgi:hypothetical protein
MRFKTGIHTATPAALKFIADNRVNVGTLLQRHVAGDCGDMDAEDKATNESAITHGGRVFSSYNVAEGRLWIITEADRSSTTILLPGDY